MKSEPDNSLEERDAEVRSLTSEQHSVELRLAEDLLTCCLRGFGHLGSFTRTEDNDPQYAWLLLTTRSFNSLRSAYALLQQGYYDQAIMLIQAVNEDSLIATDLEKNPETIQALLYANGELGKGKLTYTEMAKRVSNEFYEKTWKYNYGSLSTIAHARERALRILVDPDTKTLRLGGRYDRILFIGVCHALLRSAIIMLDFLAKVLGNNAESWQKETWPKMKVSGDWCAALEAKVKAGEDV